MALKGKLETEIEIKSTADKFYNIFRSTTHHFPKATPNIIQAVEVHEGDWDTHGSIKFWNYTIVTLVGIEGDVMNYFQSFKGTFEATPNGNGSLVKLTLEYEKLKEEVPAPIKYHNMMVTMTKEYIDAFLVKA
ncbi:hypothetical protein I3843_05G174400 [Carya illinoinensis]|uniref:Bet v I/Major latex protein domain-containing protein n=1 Tax=Carya illinoinensis TaxID=32201 RepID=A0A922F6M8_CARIL|nr:hypothetical protein I3842_05G190600 [Carya illinoinensis]KAG7980274.1 hypothetical protein I3843_05G174400 [Carya illinoinensis]